MKYQEELPNVSFFSKALMLLLERVLAENVIPCHLSDVVDFHDSYQGRDIGRVS
jgi:hypothetical protein